MNNPGSLSAKGLLFLHQMEQCENVDLQLAVLQQLQRKQQFSLLQKTA
jgi:hypothetical protein